MRVKVKKMMKLNQMMKKMMKLTIKKMMKPMIKKMMKKPMIKKMMTLNLTIRRMKPLLPFLKSATLPKRKNLPKKLIATSVD